MRVRAVLTGLVVAVGVALPPAAVSAEPVLAVEARTSGYVEVDLPAGLRLDGENWRIAGKGSRKVVLIDRVVKDRRGAGFNLLFADLPGFQAKPVLLGGSGEDELVTVPAGRYRIHVVSDAPARFSVSTPRQPARLLKVNRSSRVLTRVEVAQPAQSDMPLREATLRSEFTLGEAVVYTFSKWTLGVGPGPQTREIQDCVVPRGSSCPQGGGPGLGANLSLDRQDTVIRHEYFDSFDLPFRGPATAVTEFRGTDRPKAVAQLLVSLPTG